MASNSSQAVFLASLATTLRALTAFAPGRASGAARPGAAHVGIGSVRWLRPAEAASLWLSEPATVACTRGRLWLTIEGDGRDHFVPRGAGLACPARRRIVVEADGGAACLLLAACERAAR